MIRPATPADAPAVVDLALSSGLFGPDDVGVVEQLMARYPADGHRCVLDVDGEPVGVAYYQPAPATDRTWYLTMIGVRRGDQGKGRGRALLRHVEDDLRAAGQRLLLVETSGTPDFERSRAFYAALGYEREAQVRDYYAPGDDLVLFRTALRG